MFADFEESVHKTDLPGDQVLEVLAACCLPQLLGHRQQIKNKIRIKSRQVKVNWKKNTILLAIGNMAQKGSSNWNTRNPAH